MTRFADTVIANLRNPMRRATALRLIRHISVSRSLWYSRRFRGWILIARGSVLVIDRRARIVLAPRAVLLIGFEHLTPLPAILHMERQAKLNVKGTVQLMRGTRVLVAERAVLTIGHGTFINDHSMITCFQRIEIGSGVAIAWHVQILDSDVHQLVVANVARSRTKPVLIADRVWIGTGALVLKGVRIEQDSVVAAGAVISRSVGPGTLVAGNPAQIVRTSVTWSP